MRHLTDNINKHKHSMQSFVWRGLDSYSYINNYISDDSEPERKYGCIVLEKGIRYYPSTPKEQLYLKVYKGIVVVEISGYRKVLKKGDTVKINKLWCNAKISVITDNAVIRWNNDNYLNKYKDKEENLVRIDLVKNLN